MEISKVLDQVINEAWSLGEKRIQKKEYEQTHSGKDFEQQEHPDLPKGRISEKLEDLKDIAKEHPFATGAAAALAAGAGALGLRKLMNRKKSKNQ